MVILKYYVGIVGCGKTTIARKLLEENELLLDSDAIREELFGDAADQSNPALVFATMEKRTIDALNNGQNVSYVACNIWSRKRISFLAALKKKVKNCIYECKIVDAPIELCRQRNSARSRIVPAFVIDKQLRQFEIPYFGEGWDSISVIHNYTTKEEQDSTAAIMEKVYNFGDQHNEHHSYTLIQHCINAYAYACACDFPTSVCGAALLHDFGKAWTAQYWDKDNGKNLHFPNHANIGAWLALNQGVDLETAQLINYHMLHYTDEKCQATWRARLGEELWNELALLYEADKAAH